LKTRVLYIVKTSEGAVWAARLAGVLVRAGVEVHVALPDFRGAAVEDWRQAGASLHRCDLNVPVSAPHRLSAVLKSTRELVRFVSPDLLHTFFVANTLVLRWALGKDHRIPRLYHVAGPLHLEHAPYRIADVRSAGRADFWIASSRAVIDRYRAAGVSPSRLFLSYFGFDTRGVFDGLEGAVRRLVNGSSKDIIVGNVNLMYPPKRYLGQRVGIKAHEDVIDALGMVCRRNREVLGVLVGGAWGGAAWYEKRLRERAWAKCGDRVRFTGRLPHATAAGAWSDFSLAVHVPLSENCGGVVEPLHAGVPVIASQVGGIPEVVMEGSTGWLVPPRSPGLLAEKILHVLSDPDRCADRASRGRTLVRTMFDLERTAGEVHEIYRYLLGQGSTRPVEFDSREHAAMLGREGSPPEAPPRGSSLSHPFTENGPPKVHGHG
jgi:glycosyltransferase involved in cell wall biosynthesis